jgi:hypothetical protein
MQERLPKMGTGRFDKGDGGTRALAQAVTKPGDEFQACRAATDHDDAVYLVRAGGVSDLAAGCRPRLRPEPRRCDLLIASKSHDLAHFDHSG